MSERIRVKIRRGGTEIEIEAASAEIRESLDILDQLIAKFPRAGEEEPIEVPPTTTLPMSASGVESPPPVVASKLPDALMQLLGSDWGRTPRTLREISEALELSAKHYRLQAVSTALARLTKAGQLRRLKKGDVYSYVSAKR